MEKKFLYIFSVQKITFHIFSDFYQLDITYLSNKDKTSLTFVFILKKNRPSLTRQPIKIYILYLFTSLLRA